MVTYIFLGCVYGNGLVCGTLGYGMMTLNVQRLNHRMTIYWHIDDMDYPPLAVCYDCMCLISLIRTMMSLSYDGDRMFEWTGHDGGYDCSPAGILGYLPRCLCSPWVMDRMTEINRPGLDMMPSKTMYAGGRRPATCVYS